MPKRAAIASNATLGKPSCSEVIAIIASGTTYNRWLRPYLIAGLIFSTVLWFANRYGIPKAIEIKANFQARYIITHPATGNLDCPAGKKYLEELKERRKDELEMLTYLTGKGATDWDLTQTQEEKFLPSEDSYAATAISLKKGGGSSDSYLILGAITALIFLAFGPQKAAKRSKKSN